jgi:hypothetical protein
MEPLQSIRLSFKCPKSLDELQPCNSGYYCDGCQKIVHDFRGLADDVITARINENAGKVCGIVEGQKINVRPRMIGWKRWVSAAILTLGLTALHHTLFAQSQTKIQIDDTKKSPTEANEDFLVGALELEPTYIGGINKFYDYIKTNMPADLIQAYAHHKVIIAFTVGKDGRPRKARIVRGMVNTDADRRIVAIINNSPAWRPGTQSGKVISVQYTVPIQF